VSVQFCGMRIAQIDVFNVFVLFVCYYIPQIWRLVTSALYFGGFSMNFIFQMYILYPSLCVDKECVSVCVCVCVCVCVLVYLYFAKFLCARARNFM